MANVLHNVLRKVAGGIAARDEYSDSAAGRVAVDPQAIGILAGNGSFPLRFAEEAKRNGRRVVAVCHLEETDPAIDAVADVTVWIKLGQLGKLIATFHQHGVGEAAMVGGVNRVRVFGGIKLDGRGFALLARLRSAKDDVLMRGIAEELEKDNIRVVDSTIYMEDQLAPCGVLTKTQPTAEEENDIAIGVEAIKAMSSQDIGQMVVVQDGVIVAVEAVEGTDATIRRGGELGGKGCVVVKFAKTTQDMRFDVPTIGPKTIQTMADVKARVLAVEAGRCLIMDRDEMLRLADRHKIAVVGCAALV